MQEAANELILPSESTVALVADAERAGTWAGEPFLHAGEDPETALAQGNARRRALDDALAELDAGKLAPSARWKVRYGLMLGLERVLSEKPPRTAAGTELRRHQIDALAGMLTELIASNQQPEENGNGAALAEVDDVEEDDEDEVLEGEIEDEDDAETAAEEDPGAKRRFRFRHPTASGKTIAAAGFVEAGRTLGILILTHRRLLVSQFTRDLTTEGYGDRFAPGSSSRETSGSSSASSSESSS
jgi:ribonuclease E